MLCLIFILVACSAVLRTVLLSRFGLSCCLACLLCCFCFAYDVGLVASLVSLVAFALLALRTYPLWVAWVFDCFLFFLGLDVLPPCVHFCLLAWLAWLAWLGLLACLQLGPTSTPPVYDINSIQFPCPMCCCTQHSVRSFSSTAAVVHDESPPQEVKQQYVGTYTRSAVPGSV